MSDYEVLENGVIKWTVDGVIRTIPTDPANTDYQKYLASLDESDEL